MSLSNSFLETVSVIGAVATVVALAQAVFDLVTALRRRTAQKRGPAVPAGYRPI
jgi:hypothetical protein